MFSLLSSLEPEEQRSFMMGIFSTVEDESLASGNVLDSYADVGVSPWNPDLIRHLCLVHCPPPSQLKSTARLRKLEKILRDMRAEQEAERDRLIQIGKLMTTKSSVIVPRYQLRERRSARPESSQDKSKRPSSSRNSKSNETEPPSKRPRKG